MNRTEPSGHPIGPSVRARAQAIRRSLSPWVRRRLGKRRASGGPGRRATVSGGRTRRLVRRVQRVVERSVVWRPDVGSIEPAMVARFSGEIVKRFPRLGDKYRVRAADAKPQQEKQEMPLPTSGARPRTEGRRPAPTLPARAPEPRPGRAVQTEEPRPPRPVEPPTSSKPPAAPPPRKRMRHFSRVEELSPTGEAPSLPSSPAEPADSPEVQETPVDDAGPAREEGGRREPPGAQEPAEAHRPEAPAADLTPPRQAAAPDSGPIRPRIDEAATGERMENALREESPQPARRGRPQPGAALATSPAARREGAGREIPFGREIPAPPHGPEAAERGLSGAGERDEAAAPSREQEKPREPIAPFAPSAPLSDRAPERAPSPRPATEADRNDEGRPGPAATRPSPERPPEPRRSEPPPATAVPEDTRPSARPVAPAESGQPAPPRRRTDGDEGPVEGRAPPPVQRGAPLAGPTQSRKPETGEGPPGSAAGGEVPPGQERSPATATADEMAADRPPVEGAPPEPAVEPPRPRVRRAPSPPSESAPGKTVRPAAGERFSTRPSQPTQPLRSLRPPSSFVLNRATGPAQEQRLALTHEVVVAYLESKGYRFKRRSLPPARATTDRVARAAEELESQAGSAGRPLDDAPRATMESTLGRDFGDVRVHQADLGPLNVQAASRGRDVYVEPGQERFDTPASLSLLGHELTHVSQQGGGRPLSARPDEQSPFPFPAQLPLAGGAGRVAREEMEAEEIGRVVMRAFDSAAAGGAGPADAVEAREEGEGEEESEMDLEEAALSPGELAQSPMLFLRQELALLVAARLMADDEEYPPTLYANLLQMAPPDLDDIAGEGVITEDAVDVIEGMVALLGEIDEMELGEGAVESSPNLDRLARQVYPLIKRMMAVERERRIL